ENFSIRGKNGCFHGQYVKWLYCQYYFRSHFNFWIRSSSPNGNRRSCTCNWYWSNCYGYYLYFHLYNKTNPRKNSMQFFYLSERNGHETIFYWNSSCLKLGTAFPISFLLKCHFNWLFSDLCCCFRRLL